MKLKHSKQFGNRFIVVDWDWGYNVIDRKTGVDMEDGALCWEDAQELAEKLNKANAENKKRADAPDDGI